MKFHELLHQLGERAVFVPSREGVNKRSLTRWVGRGLLIRHRWGLYQVAHRHPHPFAMANLMDPTSHISGLSALSYFGYSEEPIGKDVFSVTRRRSKTIELAGYRFRFQKLSLKLPILNSPFCLAPAEAALLEWIWTDRLTEAKLVINGGSLRFRWLPLRYELFHPEILVGLSRETRSETLRGLAARSTLPIWRARRLKYPGFDTPNHKFTN